MHSFRIKSIGYGDTVIIEEPEQIHHLKDVLRLSAGDEVELFDETGTGCVCSIKRLGRQDVVLDIKHRRLPSPATSAITIAIALPKKGMDDVVDKLVQLGVGSIIPMRTQRVVVRVGDETAHTRVARWAKIARAAAEQSHSNRIPVIHEVTDFPSVISTSGEYDLKLIPNLSEHTKSIPDVLAGTEPRHVIVLIGPEGDFTPEEVAAAQAAGFVPVTLGHRVLRVSTAAIAVAAYFRLGGFV